MKKLICLMFVLGFTSLVMAADPWHIQDVSKNVVLSDSNKLSIKVDFENPIDSKKLSIFRVVNNRSQIIGELYSFNNKTNTLVFEGDWGNLDGLYLHGLKHDEPLFNAREYFHIDRPGTFAVNSEKPLVTIPNSDNIVYHGNDVQVIRDGDRHVVYRDNDVHVVRDNDDVYVVRDNDRIIHVGGGHDIRVVSDETNTVHVGGDNVHIINDGVTTVIDNRTGEDLGPAAAPGIGPGPGVSPGMGEGPGPGEGCEAASGEGCPCCGDSCGCGEECECKGGSQPCPCGNECSPGEGPGGPGSGPGEDCGPGSGPGEDCGPGNGPGPGTGPGSIGMNGNGAFENGTGIQGLANTEKDPTFVLYVATGDGNGPGKLYQVNEHGRILGWVNLPSTPSSVALHRQNGLILSLPRDGGIIVKIDDSGKAITVLEKEKSIVHPVDVAVGGNSDVIVVADNLSDVLVATTTGGNVPKEYRRFDDQQWTAQSMSVAVTNDGHVLMGTDGNKGIYRYSGIEDGAEPILPETGGVAADPQTTKWAATQNPNQVYIFDGSEHEKTLRLPPGKSIYRQGLLSFGPAESVVVASRDSDALDTLPWLMMYDGETGECRSLFPWDKEPMTDFVVGPRMYWERNQPNTYKSTY